MGSKPGKHFVGLKNQGATCYLNTLLQTWFMTQEVKECIASCKEEDSLICELRCLFERLSDGNERSLSTEQLTSQLNLSVYIQRDIEECFRSLVNKLSSKMDQDHKILKIYQVTMVSSLKCLKCTQSMEEDTFFLDIPLFVCSANAAEKFDLMEKSLEQFLKEEKMEGDNKCYCNICDMKTETTSRYYFKHLPQILTFQLKRFEFDYNNMAFQKITGCITFPPVLEFTRSQDARNEWCRKLTVNRVNNVDVVKGKEIPAQPQEVKQECSVDITAGNPETPQDCSQQVSTGQEEKRYELFAIWHHRGRYGSGHYYAEIKSDSGDWYNFNDEDVKKVRNCLHADVQTDRYKPQSRLQCQWMENHGN
ncbi:ubiquitin carboxyl-terminal hydrolase 47-like isoform X7 [Mobula birostris]|uniref:ubiquitin carboxyl-terminal hydrolase 47-like isoform X7 n=1 Tax=Mobula birostris TaxID=1983395 RepID=UPI003B28BF25